MTAPLDHDKTLTVRTTPIPGLLLVDLPVPGDNRGWFKENWQREKLLALGVPDLGPVQNNISFNDAVGTTRGIHAEPWDKYVSVATGRIFGAWVDLREGPSFGAAFTAELDASKAIFVPRGVGNSYQTLEPRTAYTYLVNAHWSPDATYRFLNLADETVAIDWPVPLDAAVVSAKDREHPRLEDVQPLPRPRTLVLGANGQLGRALRALFPSADHFTKAEFDVTDPAAWSAVDWSNYEVVINASAYTAVDAAESAEGRRVAWQVNVDGVLRLVLAARSARFRVVHVSTDYVFDGQRGPHDESEAFSPMNVYGQTKAAADALVSTLDDHYIVRTSWVIGDGPNFVRTMSALADSSVDPAVVDDQFGRLTFTADLAAAIRHLLDVGARSGTYNVTNEGDPVSWADVAEAVFDLKGRDASRIRRVGTAEFMRGRAGAPRPSNSVLDLEKIRRTGFTPRDQLLALRDELAGTVR